jgi:hypothetical protein
LIENEDEVVKSDRWWLRNLVKRNFGWAGKKFTALWCTGPCPTKYRHLPPSSLLYTPDAKSFAITITAERLRTFLSRSRAFDIRKHEANHQYLTVASQTRNKGFLNFLKPTNLSSPTRLLCSSSLSPSLSSSYRLLLLLFLLLFFLLFISSSCSIIGARVSLCTPPISSLFFTPRAKYTQSLGLASFHHCSYLRLWALFTSCIMRNFVNNWSSRLTSIGIFEYGSCFHLSSYAFWADLRLILSVGKSTSW